MTTETVMLWRPTGPMELALVRDAGFRAWPPDCQTSRSLNISGHDRRCGLEPVTRYAAKTWSDRRELGGCGSEYVDAVLSPRSAAGDDHDMFDAELAELPAPVEELVGLLVWL